MPLFEYKCSECGAAFEKLVMTSQRDNIECKACGSTNTERQISSFAASTGSSSSSAAAPAVPRFT